LRTRGSVSTGGLKKKAHEAVEALCLELHDFVEAAGDKLSGGLEKDVSWLEDGLRDCSNHGCLKVLLGLLNSAGTQMAGDSPENGERCVGKVPRTIHTLFGNGVLSRKGYQQEGGPIRFPADKVLGLVRGHTARRAALLTRAAARAPFEQAAADVQVYTGLPVSGRSLQRLSQDVGSGMERFLRRESLPATPTILPRVYVLLDGTGAPLRKRDLIGRLGKGPLGVARTHEVKLAAIFTQHPRPGEDPWRDMDSTTYVATDERVEAFGPMVRSEFRRRFSRVGEVVVLGDGAAWIDGIAEGHFHGATRIVDWYHAAQRVAELAAFFHPKGSIPWDKLRKRWSGKLWNGKPHAIIRDAKHRLSPAQKTEGEKQLHYFIHHAEAMRYDLFRSRGLFIGSGVVESACKTIVCQRFKASGMHWSLKGLKPILSLRTGLLSGRFQEFWNSQDSRRSHAA
jgi:hypothetical protein